MNNKAHEVIVLHPDQLNALIETAIAPIVERLDAIEKKMVASRVGYTSKEAADLVGVSDKTLRKWIAEGKPDARGVVRYLKAYQPTDARWRVMIEDLTTFIQYF